MKKRISVLVLAILFALTLTSSFAAEAVPDWPPNVYSINLSRVFSKVDIGDPGRTEDFPAGRNSTTMQHGKYEVRITVDQMGYEGQNDATLDGKQYDRLVGCEYLNANGTPTQQGQIIEGFRWTFAWDNVEAAEPFSTFKYWCTNANYPYGVHNYTATINWVNDGSPGPVLPELSTLKVNTLTETLTGAVNGVAYEYRTASTWTKVVAENSSFLIPFDTTATTLYVRYAATDTQPASNAVTISLPARPAAPSLAGKLSVSYLDSNFPNQAVLKGVPKGYLCDFFFTKTAVSSGSDIPFDYPDYSS